jgi:hypothetical protein
MLRFPAVEEVTWKVRQVDRIPLGLAFRFGMLIGGQENIAENRRG